MSDTSLKNIEVELRGPLDEAAYQHLIAYSESHGTLVSRENRFFIDYSTFIEGVGERKLDVRVRKTNGEVQIVVKKGEFGGPNRTEAIVRVKDSDLVGAVQMMGLLGYRKGVACDRGITRYDVDGIEIAIQDVRRYRGDHGTHSRFFEAEILCHEGEADAAEARIRSLCQTIGLTVYEKSAWYDYVHRINDEANGVFDLDQDDLNEIAGLGEPVMP